MSAPHPAPRGSCVDVGIPYGNAGFARGQACDETHGSRYLPVAYTEHLAAAGIKPSTGAVGGSYDNALAESVIGLYKTEPIKPRRPWKGLDDVEIATAEWVDWFNHRRPLEYCDDLTPAETEQAHYTHHQDPATVGSSNQMVSGHSGASSPHRGPTPPATSRPATPPTRQRRHVNMSHLGPTPDGWLRPPVGE